MGTCVHRARVQPSKYSKSTAVDVSDASEIYNDVLITLSHQLFHHLPQGCCLFPIHNSVAIVLEPVGTGLPKVAQAAAAAQIGWVVLNREVDYIPGLRNITQVPIFA